jgi:hypothetical protein
LFCGSRESHLIRLRDGVEAFEYGGFTVQPRARKVVHMQMVRRRTIAAIVAASMVAGGAVGATVFSAGASSAAKSPTTTTPAPPGGAPGAARGTFKPNENSAHETSESKQREAQEDAGQVPTVP